MLVAHFVHRYAESMAKQIEKITSDAMESTAALSVARKHSGTAEFHRAGGDPDQRGCAATSRHCHLSAAFPTEPVTLADAERDHILNALRESNWVVGGAAGAAARLGVKRTTLISKMRKRGLSRAMASRGCLICGRANFPD